jgi:hypothetical protein
MTQLDGHSGRRYNHGQFRLLCPRGGHSPGLSPSAGLLPCSEAAQITYHAERYRAPTSVPEPAVRALGAATVGSDGAQAGLAACAGKERGNDVGSVPVE